MHFFVHVKRTKPEDVEMVRFGGPEDYHRVLLFTQDEKRPRVQFGPPGYVHWLPDDYALWSAADQDWLPVLPGCWVAKDRYGFRVLDAEAVKANYTDVRTPDDQAIAVADGTYDVRAYDQDEATVRAYIARLVASGVEEARLMQAAHQRSSLYASMAINNAAISIAVDKASVLSVEAVPVHEPRFLGIKHRYVPASGMVCEHCGLPVQDEIHPDVREEPALRAEGWTPETADMAYRTQKAMRVVPNAPGPLREVWVNDEQVDLYLGDELLISANHDEDGWSGMDRIVKSLRRFARLTGVPIAGHEGERNIDVDDELEG